MISIRQSARIVTHTERQTLSRRDRRVNQCGGIYHRKGLCIASRNNSIGECHACRSHVYDRDTVDAFIA